MAENIENKVEEEFEEDVEEIDSNIGVKINKAVFYLNLIAGITAIVFAIEGILPVWLAVLCIVPTFTIAGVLYYKARPQKQVAGAEAKV